MAAPKADPGVGRDDSPIGSEEWAQRVRLSMQSLVNHMDFQPKSFKRYVDMVNEKRAWTLMNKPDGSYFGSWEEFCEHRQPWGLGQKWEKLRPLVEAVAGKQSVQLATVAPDQRPLREHNASGAFAPGNHSATELQNGGSNHETARRLRSVLRAPEPIQDLYRAGLIGQVEAAKLGPRDPEPVQAARIVEVARAAQAVASATPATTPREKKKVQREVNKVVRAQLGVASGGKPNRLSPVAPEPSASGLDYNRVTSAVMVMASDQLVSLRNIINGVLKSRGLS